MCWRSRDASGSFDFRPPGGAVVWWRLVRRRFRPAGHHVGGQVAAAAAQHERCDGSEPIPFRFDVPFRQPAAGIASGRINGRDYRITGPLLRRSGARHSLLTQPAQLRSAAVRHPVAQLSRTLPQVCPMSSSRYANLCKFSHDFISSIFNTRNVISTGSGDLDHKSHRVGLA